MTDFLRKNRFTLKKLVIISAMRGDIIPYNLISKLKTHLHLFIIIIIIDLKSYVKQSITPISIIIKN
jgi:hypothetical protein